MDALLHKLKGLDRESNILFIIRKEQAEKLKLIMQYFTNHGRDSAIVVAADKPHAVLSQLFSEMNMPHGNQLFIDLVSNMAAKQKPSKNIIYLDGLSHLSDLKLALFEGVSAGKHSCIVFDSLDVLFQHNKEHEVKMLLYDLLKMTRFYSVKNIFLSYDNKITDKVMFNNIIEA